jgi:type VI secretion system secreted protein Hcp
LVVTILALVLVGFPRAAEAQEEILLKIEGVDGESTLKGYEKWIGIQSWSWGVSNQPPPASVARDYAAGKAEFSPLNVMKQVDVSTAALLRAAATGNHLKKVTLVILRPDARGMTVLLKMDLEDVVVSSVQHSGSAGGEAPTESVALAFGKVMLEFFPSMNAAVKPTFSWNLMENRP